MKNIICKKLKIITFEIYRTTILVQYYISVILQRLLLFF